MAIQLHIAAQGVAAAIQFFGYRGAQHDHVAVLLNIVEVDKPPLFQWPVFHLLHIGIDAPDVASEIELAAFYLGILQAHLRVKSFHGREL